MRKKIIAITTMACIIVISMKDSSITDDVKVEDDGCASDCVRKSRNLVLAMADYAGVDPNYYVDNGFYMDLYTNCYNKEC
jgi:hypothetical protein